MEYKLVGAREEIYSSSTTVGGNCDFHDEPCDRVRWTFFFKVDKEDGYTAVSIYSFDGMCPSGWTTAQWGAMEVRKVSKTGPMTHLPQREVILKDEDFGGFDDNPYPEVENELFSVSYDGGDEWYPCGGFSVNESLLVKTNRGFDKKPCWIFYGDSNLGKSTLGLALEKEGYTVFESDAVDTLPNTIEADIIVLGNRSKWTLEDVKKHIHKDVEIVEVGFAPSSSTQSVDMDMFSTVDIDGKRYMAIKAKYLRSLKTSAETAEYLSKIFKLSDKEIEGFSRMSLKSLREMIWTLKDRFERYEA